MNTTPEKFRATLARLTTSEIIDMIARTWNTPEGHEFRAYGFDVIDERIGDELGNDLYDELWRACERRPLVYWFSDCPDALVNVARTITANESIAAFLGIRRDHAGMLAFTDAIEAADDLNGHFAASELWITYQTNAWAYRAA